MIERRDNMKIVIFGASGGIGKFATKHALNQGYEVVAYLRHPQKLGIQHKNLQVVQGELNDYEKIRNAMDGCQAIIWCVGVSSRVKGMPYLEGHTNLIRAMNEQGITRVIDWATPALSFEKDRKSIITVFPVIASNIFLRHAAKEVRLIGNLYAKSNLDWTIVRFLRPTNKKYKGYANVSFGDKKIKFEISREDIGSFMIRQIENEKYIHSMPIIGG